MKKIFTLIICVLLFLIFAGCSTKRPINNSTEGKKYIIAEVNDFNEGFAGVLLADHETNNQVFALIDKKGNVLFNDAEGIGDKNGNEYRIRYLDAQHSGGYILLPTEDTSGAKFFSLLNINGEIIYNYKVEKEDISDAFSIINIGGGCYRLYNDKDVDSIYFCGANGGQYDLPYASDKSNKIRALDDGYIMVETQTSNFSEDIIEYTIYDCTGKKIEDKLTQEQKGHFFNESDDISGYKGKDVIWWTDGSVWCFYNIKSQTYFEIEKSTYLREEKYDDRYYKRRMYENYSSNDCFLLCESFVDPRNTENNYIKIYAVNTQGEQSEIVQTKYSGSVFKNYGTYFINELNGAVIGNENYSDFDYYDFKTNEIIDLCKNFPNKKVSRVLAMNEKVIAFQMKGSDEKTYSTLLDLEGNVLLEPEKDIFFTNIGPFIKKNESDGTDVVYYDNYGKIVATDIQIESYSDGIFTLKDNYLLLDGSSFFSDACYYDSALNLVNNK